MRNTIKKRRSPNFAAVCMSLAVGLLLETWATAAQAAPLTEARVILANCSQDQTYTDPVSVSQSLMTTVCGQTTTAQVLSEGGATFSPNPFLSVNLTSEPGRGVTGLASLDDHLTFHIGGGNSAVVHVRVAGNFTGRLFPFFEVDLGLGPTFLSYRGSTTDSNNGNPGSDIYFPQTGDPNSAAGVIGSFLIDNDWTVTDGVTYEFLVGLKAGASGGEKIYIDDPVSIQLPSGVTFTSASGSTYTPVPLPSAIGLLGSGLLGLIGMMRRRTA